MKFFALVLGATILFTACGLIDSSEESTKPQLLIDEQSSISFAQYTLEKLADVEQKNGVVNSFNATAFTIDSLPKVDNMPEVTKDKILMYEDCSKKFFSPDKQNYIEVFYRFDGVNYIEASVVFEGIEIDSRQIWLGGGDDYNNVATWINNEIVALGSNIWQDVENYTASLFFIRTKKYQRLEYPSFPVPVDGENAREANGKNSLHQKSPAPQNSFSPSGRYMISYLESMNGYAFFIYDIENEQWTKVYGGFKQPTNFFVPWVQWLSDENVRFSPLNAQRIGDTEYEQREEGFTTLNYDINAKQLTEIINGQAWGACDEYIVCRSNNEQGSILLYHVDSKERLLYLPESNLTYSITSDFRYTYFLYDSCVVVYDASNRTKYIIETGSDAKLKYLEGKFYLTIGEQTYMFSS